MLCLCYVIWTVLTTEQHGQWIIENFLDSMRISTYLCHFVAGIGFTTFFINETTIVKIL